MDDVADRPGVIVLPPLLYLVALLGGLPLQWLVPLTLPVPIVARWAGVLVALLGIGFAVVARREFERAGTNVNPTQPATLIVTSGPFRVTRNPMYVAMAVGWIGVVLATRNGWYLAFYPILLAIMHWGVIRREERYLERKFGETYTEYRRGVRRYF